MLSEMLADDAHIWHSPLLEACWAEGPGDSPSFQSKNVPSFEQESRGYRG